MTEPRRDLGSVQIPEPCSADWASMLGDERRRYCDQCQLHVHNVAALPRDEAEALIARREEGEKVCVRLEYEPDGSCVTAETPRATSPQRATALALALGTGLLAACRGDEPRAPEDPQAVGGVSAGNASIESADPVRLGQVLQGDVALPVADECDATEMEGAELADDEPQPILMGRIAVSGVVTVNADGQLTSGDDAARSESPDAKAPQPTMGEVAPSEEAAEPPSDADDARREELMGKVELKRKDRVILGTPGPSLPKPKIEPEPKD